MDVPIGIQKEVFWQGHIDQMQKFKGSQAEYARANGFTLPQLLYYRDKLRKKSGFVKVRAVEAKPSPQSKPTTLPIEEKREPKKFMENFESYPQSLPDARWVAQLIRELSR